MIKPEIEDLFACCKKKKIYDQNLIANTTFNGEKSETFPLGLGRQRHFLLLLIFNIILEILAMQ